MLRAVSGYLRAFRTVAAILAIASMLCVSAASVSAAHAHSKEPIDGCGVCCTAHMAAQHVGVIQVIHAPELQSILSTPTAIRFVESRGILAFLNRGPPSNL
jgi:hypothetical protein